MHEDAEFGLLLLGYDELRGDEASQAKYFMQFHRKVSFSLGRL